MGDRDRLETVMLNLINNALDAASEAGPFALVTVRSERVSTREEDVVVVTVSDTGPGIPEDISGRIFDPFFTTKDEGRGTGLGLFLSYGIVAEHRGRLEVKNGERGAVASVVLPALILHADVHQEAGWGTEAKY
jgi:signal transduction histidine kinase